MGPTYILVSMWSNLHLPTHSMADSPAYNLPAEAPQGEHANWRIACVQPFFPTYFKSDWLEIPQEAVGCDAMHPAEKDHLAGVSPSCKNVSRWTLQLLRPTDSH